MTPRWRGRGRSLGRAGAAAFLAAVAALAWLVLAALDGLTFPDLLAGVAAALAGLLLARSPRRHREPVRAAAVGVMTTETDGEEIVNRLTTLLRDRMDAERLVLWRRHRDEARLVPFVAAGHPPAPLPSAGQPLLWALEQGQPLRLEPEPAWAYGPVLAVPVRPEPDGVVLSIESAAPPDAALAGEAAELLAGVLRMSERERRALAANARFDRLLEFLAKLPGDSDPGDFPRELARAAAEIGGGSGALVASWHEDTGRVVERWGEGGGPAAGTYIGVMSGQLAMAARARTTLRRNRDDGRMPPLAGTDERWASPPSDVVVVPLIDAGANVLGLIGVWGGEPPDEEGITLLEALGPLLALQLHHASELVRFRESAHIDPLTGLENRARLEQRMLEERQEFHRYRHPFALIVVDLDHFKRINDTLGHPAGDAVLERVGEVIRGAIREVDHAGRFGGEEFVVLLRETMRREASEVAERIRAAIEEARIEWGGRAVPVTASVGVSACPECTDDPDRVLKSADEALYESKRGGRNRVTTAPSRRPGG